VESANPAPAVTHDAGGAWVNRDSRKRALESLLLQLADDDLVFGHRSSEWLGLAPDLEEDIAFSSISQDEVGHATFYYSLLASLTGTDADMLAFGRDASERLNARLLEQENRDWAYTIARAFVYNAFEQVRLEALLQSSFEPLKQGAEKILREEHYHLVHMQTWFQNLGCSTAEAKRRLTEGLEQVERDWNDMFHLGPWEATLLEEKILPWSATELHRRWRAKVKPVFASVGTPLPEPAMVDEARSGRCGGHTPSLRQLLVTMTEVYRSDTTAQW